MKTKICSKCNIEKELSEFYVDRKAPDGLQYKCKPCMKVYDKQHHNKIRRAAYHKVYDKQYQIDNKIKLSENRRVRDAKNNARRRGWGTPQPLNEYFPDSHLHHLHTINSTTGEIDHRVAIYIPAELHNSVWHTNTNRESMLVINELAFAYLYTLLN